MAMVLKFAKLPIKREKLSIGAAFYLLAIFASFVQIMPANAKLNDLVHERAYIEDTSGEYTIEDVLKKQPTSFIGVLSLGYGGPVWIRISLPGKSAATTTKARERIFLRGRPSYIDDIVVYDPDIEKLPRPPLGDRYSIANQDLPAAVFLWEIPRTDHARDLWIRVETTSTRLIHFEVLDESDLFLSNARIDQLGAIYIGILLIFCIWALAQLVFRFDSLIATFLFCQIFSLGFGIGLLGHTRLWTSYWINAAWADIITSVFSISAGAAAIFFSLHLLWEYKKSRALSIISGVFLIQYLFISSMFILGNVRFSLNLNMLTLLIAPPILFILSAISNNIPSELSSRHGLTKKVVLGYFGITNVFSLATALPGLGIVKADAASLYIVLFYSLSVGTLMIALLQYRSFILIKQHSIVSQALVMEKKNFAQEKKMREEREAMVDMLTHELKTPLATVRLIASDNDMPRHFSQVLGHAAKDMSDVINLVAQTNLLEAELILVRNEVFCLETLIDGLVSQLDSRKQISISKSNSGCGNWLINSDQTLISLIVRNLIDNALKYCKPNTDIKIILNFRSNMNSWNFIISNISGRAGKPDPEKVFNKYYRSQKAGHVIGSGLGLYLCQGLSQRLNGKLSYSEDGDRVQFELSMNCI
jgi:two-component system, sensor histidine kinase LadS